MAREESIKILNTVLFFGKCDCPKEEAEECLKIAIEALEKQTPRTPIIENGFVKCPNCELYIRYPIADKYNNCPECGQAIKWEEEVEE